MQEIQKIRDLISRGKLEVAIKKLLNRGTSHDDDVRGLQTRLSILEDEEFDGTITPADADAKRNSIIKGLLKVVSKIETELKGKAAAPEVVENDDLPSEKTNTEEKTTKPVKTILVYHPQDSDYADGISSQLFPYIRQGNMEIFDMHNDIPPGANKEEMLSAKLENAKIILILISNDLYKRETMKIALKVEGFVKTKKVVPIRVSAYDLDGSPFHALKILPNSEKSITDFDNMDNALYEVAMGISTVVNTLIK